MSKWPSDNQADLIQFYGTPGPQVEAQLVKVVPPFQMYYDSKPIASIKFHKKCASALLAALTEIWDHYGHDQKKIDALGISKYNGAYNPRFIRGSSTKWSNHAYGAAIDINADANGFGAGHGNIPQPVIDAFKRQGARWGGDYRGRTDPMHFEFCDAGPVTVKPATLMEEPEGVDNGSDAPPAEEKPIVEETAVVSVDKINQARTDEIQVSADNDSETRGSWLKRKWRGLSGWAFGGGATGLLGYLTSPWAIVAVAGCVVFIVILIVLFMGPSDVRAWVRKQVS